MSCLIRGKSAYLFFLLFLFTLALVGCTDKQKDAKYKKEDKNDPSAEQKEKSIFPIKYKDGDFIQVVGWLSKQSIAYIGKTGTSYQLYEHQLATGKDKLLYESDKEIVTAKISPDLQKVLVHTNSLNGGEITIIDARGGILYRNALESFEAEFVWNPFTNNEIAVTIFKEDWSSNVFLLNIKDQQLKEEVLIPPFSQWAKKEELAAINWQEQDAAMQSPLQRINLRTQTKDVYHLPNVYAFSATKDAMMTISTDEKKDEQALYTFYDRGFQSSRTMSVPRLAKFNEWFVPYFAMNKDYFYTFVPKQNGDVETYNQGFTLVSFDIKNGMQKNIGKQSVENEPISLSPNGEWLLYGYYLDKVINLNTGKIQPISINTT